MQDDSEDYRAQTGMFGTIFEEPDGYFKPKPEPHTEVFQRENGAKMTVRLVGSHPLWAHELWNASRVLAEYLDSLEGSFLTNKCVLELGAGGALPSLIATLKGALRVVITDFPDAILLENIEYNVKQTIPENLSKNVTVIGHAWGRDIEQLVDVIKPVHRSKYDVILCSDLVFNHSAHIALLQTIVFCLADNGIVYMTFSHHRPWLMDKDLAFFSTAQQSPFNLIVEKIASKMMWPMFPNDPGPAEIRQQVHFYTLRKQKQCPTLSQPQ